MSKVRAIARAITPDEGGIAAVGPDRSQSVISLALTIDERATTAPIERSMPPEMITTAAPTERMPNSATWWSNVWRLYSMKNACDESR